MTDLHDLETRKMLTAVLTLVKTQIQYVQNLHEALSVLFAALEKDLPNLRENQRAEMQKIRLNVSQQQQMREVERMLEELGKVQED